MKIKTKLTFGVGLLFLFIMLLSIVGAGFIRVMKQDTQNILVANYNSVEYVRNMLIALDGESANKGEALEKELKQQEKNVTEVGEDVLTAHLRKKVDQLKLAPANTEVEASIRTDILRIMEMNMQAIQRKSEVATNTADSAIFWISITGSLCFVIAFILLINLPSSISAPLREITESIRQIAARDYTQRVHFESNSEFGQLARSFNTMAEKLEEYNNSSLAKVMTEKKMTETLIDNMHDPVIGFDADLKIIFVNEVAVNIIGLSKQDIIGRHAHELAVKNDLIRSLVKDMNLAERPKAETMKIYADNKEGYFEKVIVHISINPTGEQERKLIGHVIILRNVTEYKELDFAKTNFIATVSHEFKTPIASIKMGLQLLENEKIGMLSEDQKNLVDGIKDDIGRLLKITGELLNMTQVESGKIQITVAPADIQQIVNYAINANRSSAELKQIMFQLDMPEKMPMVQADSEKTAWVITNLISNAIRYSYDNSNIYLSVKIEGEKVKIMVKDTGQGIAPQYKEKIFNRYFQVPGSKKEGTGLGLAISKEFIEAQGGQIFVESDYGAGSCFCIYLNSAA